MSMPCIILTLMSGPALPHILTLMSGPALPNILQCRNSEGMWYVSGVSVWRMCWR